MFKIINKAKNIQADKSYSLNLRISSLLEIEDEIITFKHKNYKIQLTYPFSKCLQFEVEVESSMSVLDVAAIITNIYGFAYHSKELADQLGIWGHALEDLYIEGIAVDEKKAIIHPIIGS